jgi:acetone carboxylase, gamma subunit
MDDLTVRRLTTGESDEDEIRALLRTRDIDPDRLAKYNAILQETVSWDDPILLRLSEHLFIVRNAAAGRVVKCACGHDFGDYRENWKLDSVVHVRSSREDMLEIFTAGVMPDPEYFEVREFYCPACAAQLGVEIVPPGYPLIFEMLPDLDRLYGDWLRTPLPDQADDWYRDLTWDRTNEWGEDVR